MRIYYTHTYIYIYILHYTYTHTHLYNQNLEIILVNSDLCCVLSPELGWWSQLTSLLQVDLSSGTSGKTDAFWTRNSNCHICCWWLLVVIGGCWWLLVVVGDGWWLLVVPTYPDCESSCRPHLLKAMQVPVVISHQMKRTHHPRRQIPSGFASTLYSTPIWAF